MLATAIARDADRVGLLLDALVPVGSLRRFAPDIGNVTLVGVAPAALHAQVLDAIARLPLFLRIAGRGADFVSAETERGDISIHIVAPEHAGSALVWHTGSLGHTRLLQARARSRALTFEKGRLIGADGAPLAAPTEHSVYERLGLPYIAPELREGADEVAAAERGELPVLVDESDIRGDLHMHSTWSDGRDSIEQMAFGALQLGYEYIAITDHSERSLASRSLAASDIGRQRREIEKLRKRLPRLTILHGIEVDILHDGSLDFDDTQLETFDIVLASLHDHGGQAPRQLTDRYLQAIRHPLVNIITHPANRSPARSSGYPLDFDRLFDAASANGTAMEIDGAPGHLDMDGALARRAAARGVTVAIDSDCHRADALARQMSFGLGTARRGWIEARHVLNARPLEDVRAFIAAKRARR